MRTVNSPMTFIENKNSHENEVGLALGGSILITALVMFAIVRWAASGTGYGSLLVSLGIAGASSLLLCTALWSLPGAGQPRSHSPAQTQPQTI